MSAHQWFAEMSLWWWPRFADHLWQSTLFAIVILAAVFALRCGPARVRHTFWLLASAKFIVPVSLFVSFVQLAGLHSLSFLSGTRDTEQNALLLQGLTRPVSLAFNYELATVANSSIIHNEVYCALTFLWLSGSTALFLIWGLRRRAFMRSLKAGRRVQDGREWEALKRAQESLGFDGNIQLVVSSLKIEPGVWRVWRPVIVLPESIATLLDDDELEAIMVHELVHIQRRDNLVGNFHLAICALLWFHPLVWFIRSKLFDEREQACDEKVMEVCGAPEAYASSILKVVRFCFGWKVAGATGAASGSNLRRRIENIMSTTNATRKARPASRLLAGTLVGAALIVLVGAGVYSRPRGSGYENQSLATGVRNDVAMNAEPVGPVTHKIMTSEQDPQTPPAQPVQPTQPAQPTQPVQPAQPTQPAQPAQPTSPSPTTPLAPSSPAGQPLPPTPLTPESERQDAGQKSKDKVEKGELIEAPPPVYPEEAKKDKVEGLVTVAIVIGEEGNVISAKAKSGPEALHSAAETAASKARFKPTTVNGKPAKVSGAMSYNFVLDKE